MYANLRDLALAVGAFAIASAMPGLALAAPPADWSKVSTKTVTLFYTGQGGYQWLRSSSHKRANKKVLAGDASITCHEGEEADIGDLIVLGEKLEPNPIPGKNGALDLKVQAGTAGPSNLLHLWQSDASLGAAPWRQWAPRCD